MFLQKIVVYVYNVFHYIKHFIYFFIYITILSSPGGFQLFIILIAQLFTQGESDVNFTVRELTIKPFNASHAV